MLGVGVAYIVRVVGVIVLECKSVLYVLHVRCGFRMLTHGCGNTCGPVSRKQGQILRRF